MRAPDHSHRGDPDPVPDRVISRDGISMRADLRRYLAALFPAWHRDAACAGSDLALFFPAKGGSNREALELCGMCSVREECLAEAMADEALDWGVRGGLTAQARKARRRNDERSRRAET